MIVTCPGCTKRYSVPLETIGTGKMVRCTTCGAVWQQCPIDAKEEKKRHAIHLIQWTFFYFVVFVSILTFVFSRNLLIKIWPAIGDFYECIAPVDNHKKSDFVLKNVAPVFMKKHGILYVQLRGELINTSSEVKSVPNIVISLKNEEDTAKTYKHVWTHELAYEKLLPYQHIVFETEPQPIPFNNLLCSIQLNFM